MRNICSPNVYKDNIFVYIDKENNKKFYSRPEF